MFASLDRNENRLLRCYLITDQGEIPVKVPHSDKGLIDQIRSMPTRGLLSKLATKMAQETWVSGCDLIERPVRGLPREPVMDSTGRDFAADGPSPLNKGLSKGTEAKNGGLSYRGFRTLGGLKPLREASYVAEFSRVRVEVWRIRFNSENRQLIAQKLAEVTKDRDRL